MPDRESSRLVKLTSLSNFAESVAFLFDMQRPDPHNIAVPLFYLLFSRKRRSQSPVLFTSTINRLIAYSAQSSYIERSTRLCSPSS